MSEWTVKAKNDARNAEADLALIISRSVPRQMSRAIDFIDGVYVCRPPDAIGILHIPRQMLIRSTARKTPTESKETAAETLYETITSPAGLARLQALSDAYARTMTQITAEKMAADLNFRKREQKPETSSLP